MGSKIRTSFLYNCIKSLSDETIVTFAPLLKFDQHKLLLNHQLHNLLSSTDGKLNAKTDFLIYSN